MIFPHFVSGGLQQLLQPLPRGERGGSKCKGQQSCFSNFFGGTVFLRLSARKWGSQNPEGAPLRARGAAPLRGWRGSAGKRVSDRNPKGGDRPVALAKGLAPCASMRARPRLFRGDAQLPERRGEQKDMRHEGQDDTSYALQVFSARNRSIIYWL